MPVGCRPIRSAFCAWYKRWAERIGLSRQGTFVPRVIRRAYVTNYTNSCGANRSNLSRNFGRMTVMWRFIAFGRRDGFSAVGFSPDMHFLLDTRPEKIYK